MRIPAILCLITAIVLGGCNVPAGSQLDEGGFGAPTMNNTMLMSGELSSEVVLGTRFAREVNPTVNFAFDSAVISPEAGAILRRQADWIRQFPELRFRVYGFTDKVGTEEYNYRLGLRRAHAVVAYLERQGISRSRLEAVVSYGKTRPLIPVPGPEVRNRRAVTEVTGFVSGKPIPMNGKYAAVVFREYVASAIPPHPQNSEVTVQVDPGAGN